MKSNTKILNFDFTLDLKTVLFFGLIAYLLLSGFFNDKKNLPQETTNTTIITLEQVDSIVNNSISKIPPQTVKVAISPNNEVRELQHNEALQQNETAIELNKVLDTLQLSNATVYSTILTNGNIFSHKAKVTTLNTHTTTNTTIKVPKSVTFLNIEPNFNIQGKILGANLSIDRTVKNKFRFGAGLGYNNHFPAGEKFYTTLKIGVQL